MGHRNRIPTTHGHRLYAGQRRRDRSGQVREYHLADASDTAAIRSRPILPEPATRVRFSIPPDYAREGELQFGAKSYHVMLLDAIIGGDFRGVPGGGQAGIFLLIDVNNNGVFDTRGEIYGAGQPFNIGGVTYAIQGLTASGDTFELVKSPTKVAEIPPPPDLRIGKVVPAFTKKGDGWLDGPLSRPAIRANSSCSPSGRATAAICAAEMPELVKAYQLFHRTGARNRRREPRP